MVKPVLVQIVGAVLLSLGVGVWLGLAGFLICAGLCATLGGTVAELAADAPITETTEGVNDGPRATD